MNKVYIVTSGAYSDYSIEEVFDNREDAEKYICLYNNDGYWNMRIEEYDICKNEELKNAGYHPPLFFIHHYCAFALVILSAASKMPSLPDSYVRPPCI